MYRTRVQWATKSDLFDNKEFVAERRAILNNLVQLGKTTGVPVINNDNFSATLDFQDESTAQYWLDYVTELAEKYSKTITSKTLEVV
jgi:2-phosphoglycerate kinase